MSDPWLIYSSGEREYSSVLLVRTPSLQELMSARDEVRVPGAPVYLLRAGEVAELDYSKIESLVYWRLLRET